MPQLLLALAMIVGLLMIPFGMPGTLIIFAAVLCFYLLVPTGGIGLATVIGVGLLMALAEGFDLFLASKFARKYGGSRRAGWGAAIGGMIGTFMGVPVPLIGSVIGALVGAFVGALVGELSRGSGGGTATRVAWGALIGRVTAAAIKIGVGLVMTVWVLAVAVFR